MALGTVAYARTEKVFGQLGAIPQYAVKVDGLIGNSEALACVNYIESPFDHDVVILEAYIDITTVAAVATDLDIGTADDGEATGLTVDIFDGITTTAAGIQEGLAVRAIAGVAKPIWTAKDSANDSFICTDQNGAVDASALVYNLILVVAPESAFE